MVAAAREWPAGRDLRVGSVVVGEAARFVVGWPVLQVDDAAGAGEVLPAFARGVGGHSSSLGYTRRAVSQGQCV